MREDHRYNSTCINMWWRPLKREESKQTKQEIRKENNNNGWSSQVPSNFSPLHTLQLSILSWMGQGRPHHGLQNSKGTLPTWCRDANLHKFWDSSLIFVCVHVELFYREDDEGSAWPPTGIRRRGALDGVPMGGYSPVQVPLVKQTSLCQYSRSLQLQVFKYVATYTLF